MSLDTLHITLKKVEAILCAATPLYLEERDLDRMTWLVGAATDYIEAALQDLDAEMHNGSKEE